MSAKANPGALFYAVVFLVLFFPVSAVRALDWSDAAWSAAGCPQEPAPGRWIARNDSPNAPQVLDFNAAGLTQIFPDRAERKARITPVSGNRTGKFFNLEEIGEAAEASGVVRIRPHAVFPAQSSDADPECLIKVFWFADSRDAALGKYRLWNIYYRKSNP